MQAGLDKISFNKLQIRLLVRPAQTMLNISFNFNKIFVIGTASGRPNTNTQPK